jgi:FkbM family methyltransferase
MLAFRPVNTLLVKILGRFSGIRWRSRIPVIGGVARLSTGSTGVVEFVNTDRCGIARELFWNDGELELPCDRLALEIAMSFSAEVDLFLDIGTYTGLFALAVARRNPSIISHAYEIVPENFLYLWENVFQNDLVTRVEPRLIGLGEKQGLIRVPMSFGPGVLASSVALDSDPDKGILIPVNTLDGLYGDCKSRVMMKIDVEGFEWAVFRGGQDLLSRQRPDIICEVLRGAPNIPEMQEMLGTLGYNFFHIKHNGLSKQDTIRPARLERDWLFTIRSENGLRSLGFPIIA